MNGRIPEHPRACGVQFSEHAMTIELEDGRELSVPLEWFPKLRDADPAARGNWRLIGKGVGIHWPDLDEDLSVRALLAPIQTSERPVLENLGDDLHR
jgi:hypothetical protein